MTVRESVRALFSSEEEFRNAIDEIIREISDEDLNSTPWDKFGEEYFTVMKSVNQNVIDGDLNTAAKTVEEFLKIDSTTSTKIVDIANRRIGHHFRPDECESEGIHLTQTSENSYTVPDIYLHICAIMSDCDESDPTIF